MCSISKGLLVPMAALICIAFVTCSSPYLAVIGLVVALGFKYATTVDDICFYFFYF